MTYDLAAAVLTRQNYVYFNIKLFEAPSNSIISRHGFFCCFRLSSMAHKTHHHDVKKKEAKRGSSEELCGNENDHAMYI